MDQVLQRIIKFIINLNSKFYNPFSRPLHKKNTKNNIEYFERGTISFINSVQSPYFFIILCGLLKAMSIYLTRSDSFTPKDVKLSKFMMDKEDEYSSRHITGIIPLCIYSS